MVTAELPLDLLEWDRSVYRESFYDYVRGAWPHIESAPFVDNWHIGCIAEHLQAVTAGQIQDLLINVPPGCSKSLECCVFWPTWEWTLDPSVRFFFASYDQQLSTRDSVKCRTLVSSQWYESLWPGRVRFKKDQDQKTYYETTEGGYRLATSIGGHGTGEHPDRVLVDDPHNVRKAESDVERQRVIDWWDLTMPTRGLSRKARRVVIMQRLHPRDLSAHWLAQNPDLVHLCLPMRYEKGRMKTTVLGWQDPRTEEGELLTPKQFPEEVVTKLEKVLGPYGTAGQLQQRPQPRGGGLFKPQWFNRRARAAPREAVRVRYIDRAATESGGCYTAMVLMAKAPDGTLYVEDVVHGQWEPNERNDRIVATAHRDRLRYGPRHEPIYYVEAERGSTGLESFQRLAARLAGFRIREDRPSGSKDVRAEPWSDQLAAGNVVICDGGMGEGSGKPSWDVDGYIQEHLLFMPDASSKRLGKYKDQVDASSGALNMLARSEPLQEIKVIRFRADGKTTHPRLVVCPLHLLPSLHIEDRTALLLVTDPLSPLDSPPENALTDLVDHATLAFAALDPRDHQESWNTPVEPYGKPAEELIMNRDHAKALWRWFTKPRQPPVRVFVFADADGRTASSIAKAVGDVSRIPREGIWHAAAGDTYSGRGNAEIPHVYEMTKSGRGLVL